MKAAVLLTVALAGCTPATAAARIGKVVSAPYPKVEVAEPVAVERTTTTAPTTAATNTTVAPEHASEPAPTAPPRDLLAECRAVVAELLPIHPPAPGWADPVCHEPDPAVEAEFGRPLEGYALWREKTIHLTPTNPGLDLRFLYLHEVGHSFCANAGDYTEACADAWAVAA